jgi:hypothetical protein
MKIQSKKLMYDTSADAQFQTLYLYWREGGRGGGGGGVSKSHKIRGCDEF